VQGLGKLLVLLGLSLALVGGVVWLSGNRLHWLGRLPGDVRIGSSVFIPLTTCLVLSVLLTILINVIARLFWR